MEAKLDLHSQKLTALVANIPRTDEGFEDLSQRITVLKIIKSILPKQEKKSEVFYRQREEEGDIKDFKTVVGEEKEELHQVEDCVLKDQEELRNVEKKVLKEEELQKVEESMEKENKSYTRLKTLFCKEMRR